MKRKKPNGSLVDDSMAVFEKTERHYGSGEELTVGNSSGETGTANTFEYPSSFTQHSNRASDASTTKTTTTDTANALNTLILQAVLSEAANQVFL